MVQKNTAEGKYAFISYTHIDSEIVDAIVAELTRRGYRVWYDRRLNGGTYFWDEIILRIKNCTVFIGMWSEAASKNDNVRNEWEMAQNCGKDIIPIILDDSEFDRELELKMIRIHHIRRSKFRSFDGFMENISSIPLLKSCREENDNKMDKKQIKDELLKKMTRKICVQIGRYPQYRDDPAPIPIDWRILDIRSDHVMLIAKSIIDFQPYHSISCELPWNETTLRGWLNKEFYESAFSKEEREHLILCGTSTEATVIGKTKDAACDHVFCLSKEEAEQYFASDKDRIAIPTDYADHAGAIHSNESDSGRWWLRTLGSYGNAAYVGRYGTLRYNGFKMEGDKIGVRPVICVRLSYFDDPSEPAAQ